MASRELLAITRSDFGNKRWRRYASYEFARGLTTVPIVGAELSKALVSLPLAFIPQGEGFVFSALLSVVPGENFYIDASGRWLAGYVPAALRGYPFALATPEGGKEPILCFDNSGGLLRDGEDEGELFFEDEGKVAEPVRQVMDFLTQIEANRKGTQVAVDALADAGLLKQWPLKVQNGDATVDVNGVFCVDEAALNGLDGEGLLALRRKGALALAYGQLFSMNQMGVLQKLGAHFSQQREKLRAAQEVASLDELFDLDGGDDILRF